MSELLLVIHFPEGGDEPDPDILADQVVAIVNEERQRNADEAGRPGYYKPLEVNAIPGPQWVNGEGLAILVRAIRLVQDAEKPSDDLAEVVTELERCIGVAPNLDARTAYEWVLTFIRRDATGEGS